MEWPADDRFIVYKQYKDDTEAIAGWLTHNSRLCGYKSCPRPGSENAPTTRLKGKARKEARSTVAQITISVSEFLRMAESIADFRPRISVPEALGNLFDRVIASRRRFTEWHENISQEEANPSNQRHTHFTDVLTAAWEVLRPFQTSQARKLPANVPTAPKPESIANLTNRFAGLHVEQLPDSPDIETSSSARHDKSDYKLDVTPVKIVKSEEDIEEDFYFGIYGFMRVLQDTRAYIRRVWSIYKGGVSELIASSLLTNMAIQYVRKAEHELDMIMDRPKKFPASRYPVGNFPDILFHSRLSSGCRDLDSFLKPSAACHDFSLVSGLGEKTLSFLQICLAETYDALKHSLYELELRNTFLPVVDRSDIPEQATETIVRVKQILPSFVGVPLDKAFAIDEITYALRSMYSTRTISIWVAFAIQLLLDIQDELKDVPQMTTEEVQKHAHDRLPAIKGLDINKEPFSRIWPYMRWLKADIVSYEDEILGDGFRKRTWDNGVRDRSGRKMPFDSPAVRTEQLNPDFLMDRDYYLRMNPVACGLLKYGLYLQPHYMAFRVEDDWRGVTNLIHLYCACRLVFPDDPVWPDMEYCLQHQDLGKLFFGGIPSSLDQAYKKHLLAMGVSATSFARDSKPAYWKLNLPKGRWVSNPCALDEFMYDWARHCHPLNDNDAPKLTKIATDPKFGVAKARKVKLKLSTLPWGWNADVEVPSTLSLLDQLGCQIMAETCDLYFDWLSFIETCQKIWKEIYDMLDEETGKQAKRNPCNSTIEILEEARWCEGVAKKINADEKSEVRKHATTLVRTWDIIQKVNRTPWSDDNEGGPAQKVWGGDKEFFRVISKLVDGTIHQILTLNSLPLLYENWPEEDLDASAAIRINQTEKIVKGDPFHAKITMV